MINDHRRDAAARAVHNHLVTRDTNVIADRLVWQAVNIALDAYEDEIAHDARGNTYRSWAVMHHGRPVLVVPTKRLARQQRRLLATLGQESRSNYAILPTQVTASFPPIPVGA